MRCPRCGAPNAYTCGCALANYPATVRQMEADEKCRAICEKPYSKITSDDLTILRKNGHSA